MNTSRKIAIVVGVLYLVVNIVTGPPSLLLEAPILDTPDYLVNISANETQFVTAELLGFFMAVGIAGIGLVVYPVLKQHSASIAILYVGSRLTEGILIIVGQASKLALLPLSQEFVKAGAPDASYFQTLGELLQAVSHWDGVLMSIVFPIGALLFYYLLYRSKLIPRWLSVFCFTGPILSLPGVFLVLYGLIEVRSTIDISMQIPLMLSELTLAVWLIVKGFNSSVIASKSANTT